MYGEQNRPRLITVANPVPNQRLTGFKRWH